MSGFNGGKPIGGWKKCLYEEATFDTEEEFRTACILEDDSAVEWWFRNVPFKVTISTPAGGFNPDFVYSRRKATESFRGLLEVKGDYWWDAPDGEAQIKARSAGSWVTAANIAGNGSEPSWEFLCVNDQEVHDCLTLGDLRAGARYAAP